MIWISRGIFSLDQISDSEAKNRQIKSQQSDDPRGKTMSCKSKLGQTDGRMRTRTAAGQETDFRSQASQKTLKKKKNIEIISFECYII